MKIDFKALYKKQEKKINFMLFGSCGALVLNGYFIHDTLIDPDGWALFYFYIPLLITILFFVLVYKYTADKDIFSSHIIGKALFFMVILLYNCIVLGALPVFLFLGGNQYLMAKDTPVEKVSCKVSTVYKYKRWRINKKTVLVLKVDDYTKQINMPFEDYDVLAYKETIDLYVKKGRFGYYIIERLEY